MLKATTEQQELNSSAKLLYEQILDAGIQFQLLSAGISTRTRLIELAEEVAPLMVLGPRTNSGKLNARFSAAIETFEALCNQVPGYSKKGLQGLSHQPYARELAIRISENVPILKSLQETSKIQKTEMNSAFARLKEVSRQPNGDDPQWKEVEDAARNSYETARKASLELDRQIHIITFFGADLVPL